MQHSELRIIRVAVPSPLRRTFDYTLPQDSGPSSTVQIPQIGSRVEVEFGRRKVVGLVTEIANKSEFSLDKLKPISAIIDSEPLLPDQLFKLFLWAANYYQHPIGEALFSSLPVLLRKGKLPPSSTITCWQLSELGQGLGPASLNRAPVQKALIDQLRNCAQPLPEAELRQQFSKAIVQQLVKKELIESVEVADSRSIKTDNILKNPSLRLDTEQQIALDKIAPHHFACYLLDGVTSSGKTEIYLQSIEKTLRYGRQSLVLIPEISLTPQTQQRFTDRFNTPVVVMHSGMTDQARLKAWEEARSGHAKIILGTRSAIFTPLKDPGLLVLDEEHDQSYKQQDGFKYSARDLAVMRAQTEDIPIVLGSATPSLESLNNCIQGRYQHLILNNRAANAKNPDWLLIDLRKESTDCGIADSTLNSIRHTLSNGQQVLIFLNRRGYAPVLLCHNCGWTSDCAQCDAKLTVHRARGRLICHHCDYQMRPPGHCPSCNSEQLVAAGDGTERSADYLQRQFPNTPVLRIDRDSTRKQGAMQKFFETAQQGQPCILIGTQMLAKGHHFANVTLVTILDADSGLLSPDFRSHERMAQLLTQVAGRSGRGTVSGKVLVQTHQPHHPLLNTLITMDYRYIANDLLKQRTELKLPPTKPMAILRAESSQAHQAQNFLTRARECAQWLATDYAGIGLLGPLPALMEKRNGRYRYYFQIESTTRAHLQRFLSSLANQLEGEKHFSNVRWTIDVDPQEF
jgi:primosomal protein N' (replication factor Y)